MKRKYPKTPHLCFSNVLDKTDNVLDWKESEQRFRIGLNEEIVITEKMDGENISIYKDSWHSRSLDSRPKHYHSYLQNVIVPKIQEKIDEGIIIHGEYLYARHSIPYENLESYFYIFGIETEKGVFLSWNETKKIAEELGFPCVKVFFEGKMKNILQVDVIIKYCNDNSLEGLVVRDKSSFYREEFDKHIAKHVCWNHEKTPDNWNGKEKNNLRRKND